MLAVVVVALLVLGGLISLFAAVCKRRVLFGLGAVLLWLVAIGIATYYVSRPAETLPLDPNPDSSFRMVVLGDSYISGQGAERYFPGTDQPGNRCHRAATAHPYLVAEAVGASLTSFACSGAETKEVLEEGQHRAQIDELRSAPDPDVVLISIGGNDAKFSDIGRDCGTPGEASCLRSADYWLDRLDTEVYPAVERTYAAVRDAAPGAEVFAVGYPSPVGDRFCPDIALSEEEMDFIRAVFVERLNEILDYAARRARIRMIPMGTALNGHRFCEVPLREAAINFVKLGRTAGSRLVLSAEALGSMAHGTFHPNELGHRLMAVPVREAVEAARAGTLEPLAERPAQDRPPPYKPKELDPLVGRHGFPRGTACGKQTLAFVTPTRVGRGVREVSVADLEPRSTVCFRTYRGRWRSKRTDRNGRVVVPVNVERAGVASINEILVQQSGGVWKKVVASRIGDQDEGQEPEERSNLLLYLVIGAAVLVALVAIVLHRVGCRPFRARTT